MSGSDSDPAAVRGYDPGRWGYSMANFAELMLPVIEASGARSVAEVGAYGGDLTEVLVEWAEPRGVAVTAIDPLPQPALEDLAARRPELDLIRLTSAEALAAMELADAFVIDGDHNYHTVSEELATIADRKGGAEMPLLLFHDVCWPHGRRDSYYAPERVPEEYQESIVADTTIFPGEPGTGGGGLPYPWAAAREGGPRNGVLTAIEDFAAGRPGVRVAAMPMFFGFGVAWHEDAPWAGAVAELVEPWDRNPILTRLEANRAFHLANQIRTQVKLEETELVLGNRIERLEAVLRGIQSSRAFQAVSRITALRADGPSWSEQIDLALSKDDPQVER
ncbi:MAG TPA: class I SAM-dependent methyltransferase [Solirubrobacterales bacterium]|nr:class I SAM-dependent methyltransferase [Solirubrobacterales bacterium]